MYFELGRYAPTHRRPDIGRGLSPNVFLASALNTTTDEILGLKPAKANGPTGKVWQVFEQVSRLPHKQQAKVVEFVEAFVLQKAASQ